MKKVMVVEDDLAVLEMVGTLLSDAGYYPILLSSSDRIPEKVAAQRPDLIILDILVEPRHGMEVLASLSELRPRPPVILISGAVQGVREMGQIARALGCQDFIEKPFDIGDFLARVGSVLQEAAV